MPDRCRYCGKETVLDSPGLLCEEHWQEWWMCDECDGEECARHQDLRELRRNILEQVYQQLGSEDAGSE